jgi:hypothetical protein
VKNETDAEVSIKLKTLYIDSVYTIDVNETKILLITDHGVEGPGGPHFEDVSNVMQQFFGNQKRHSDFIQKSPLQFILELNNGLYLTTILEEEFD